jgi:hypothetical protein
MQVQSRSENINMYLQMHYLLLQNNLKLNGNTKLQTNVENCVPFRHNTERLRVTHEEHSHQVRIVVGQFFLTVVDSQQWVSHLSGQPSLVIKHFTVRI